MLHQRACLDESELHVERQAFRRDVDGQGDRRLARNILDGRPVGEPEALVDELAERMAGGVNTIVALDPAQDFPFGYNPHSAGQINFAITNEGREAHGFVVESGGVIVAELPRPLEPGASAVLSTPLFEGTYLVYCPVGEGEHRAEGMEAELLVTP